MAKVSKRGGFSDRNNIKSENTEIQLTEFDRRTRIQLQNMIMKLYHKTFAENTDEWNPDIQEFFIFILDSVFSEPIDMNIHYFYANVFKLVNETIQRESYDDVLTLIEAIVQYLDDYLIKKKGYYYYDEYNLKYKNGSLYKIANECFEKEYIGYRFIDRIIVPISDQNEITGIEEALDCKFDVVRKHIKKAGALLADRDNPDYENSIKESISAVEAVCEKLTGITGKEATLGKMLKKLEDNGVKIHSGLKSAFNALYGYTSDSNGIRHAGNIGGPTATFEEAKFMLVSCSAFINYLLAINAD